MCSHANFTCWTQGWKDCSKFQRRNSKLRVGFLCFYLVRGQNTGITPFGQIEHIMIIVCIIYCSLQLSQLRYLRLPLPLYNGPYQLEYAACHHLTSRSPLTAAYCSSLQADLSTCTVTPTCTNWSSTSMLHLSSSHTTGSQNAHLHLSLGQHPGHSIPSTTVYK